VTLDEQRNAIRKLIRAPKFEAIDLLVMATRLETEETAACLKNNDTRIKVLERASDSHDDRIKQIESQLACIGMQANALTDAMQPPPVFFTICVAGLTATIVSVLLRAFG